MDSELNKSLLNQVTIDKLLALMDDIDKEYFKRRWNTDISIYINRLKAINFENCSNVLDAGFGVGQWLYCLAGLNQNIYGIEYSPKRFEVTKNLLKELNITNVNLAQGSIEEMPYEDNFFDSVFCYSVIYQTDFKKSFKEIHRVLKKNGHFYFNTNDLGWYVCNLFDTTNTYNNFSPKQYALDSIQNSLSYYLQNIRQAGNSIIMPQKYIVDYITEIGFEVIGAGPDGSLNQANIENVKSFYPAQYQGFNNVYEVLCKKVTQ